MLYIFHATKINIDSLILSFFYLIFYLHNNFFPLLDIMIILNFFIYLLSL